MAELSDKEWAMHLGIKCQYPDGADRCAGCRHYRDPKRHTVCEFASATPDMANESGEVKENVR